MILFVIFNMKEFNLITIIRFFFLEIMSCEYVAYFKNKNSHLYIQAGFLFNNIFTIFFEKVKVRLFI